MDKKLSLQELWKQLEDVHKTYELDYEHAIGADLVLTPKPDTFEVVPDRHGKSL